MFLFGACCCGLVFYFVSIVLGVFVCVGFDFVGALGVFGYLCLGHSIRFICVSSFFFVEYS